MGPTNGDTFYVVFLSFALVGLSVIFQGNVGINLADEGFVWYGAVRTAMGEIPIRDFQAYDPGRYYWSALWSPLLGSGIIAHRISQSLFQAIGLCFGLLAVKRVCSSRWMISLVGILLIAWMLPRYKLFEPAISMTAIWVAVLLIERPSLTRHFTSGLFVGLAAFIGRNHGLYNFVGFFLLILYLRWQMANGNLPKKLGFFSLGVFTGYLPMLSMFIFVPGFFDAYLANCIWPVLTTGTNIYKPIPWPWVEMHSISESITHRWFLFALFQSFSSICFIIMPVFYIFSLVVAFRSDRLFLSRGKLLVASAFIGLFYQHHAFERADTDHLMESIHPFLIGMVALPHAVNFDRNKMFRFIAVFFVSIGILLGVRNSYYGDYLRALGTSRAYVKCNVGEDSLLAPPYTAELIKRVSEIVSDMAPTNQAIFIAPHWPGFYAILNKKSPVWQIYFLVPASIEKQENMILQMKSANTEVAIIGDVPLDGRDDLRFKNTHPLLWSYINKNYSPVSGTGLPSNYQLMVRKRIY